MSENPCPCLSQKKFLDCCGKFLEKKEIPKTAEELMRSRYTAYELGAIDYLFDTHHKSTKGELNRDEMTAWSKEAQWHGLEILKTDAGGASDNQGLVEFVCHYEVGGKVERHHEISSFLKEDGRWFFHEGRFVHETIRRESPKIGRNDPCSCGSGKKFKKCCGV